MHNDLLVLLSIAFVFGVFHGRFILFEVLQQNSWYFIEWRELREI